MIVQLWIALTGCSSSWMIHSGKRETRLIACLLAIAGQPAWFYAAWQAHQWGIMFMDAVYTLGWLRGFYLNIDAKGW